MDAGADCSSRINCRYLDAYHASRAPPDDHGRSLRRVIYRIRLNHPKTKAKRHFQGSSTLPTFRMLLICGGRTHHERVTTIRSELSPNARNGAASSSHRRRTAERTRLTDISHLRTESRKVKHCIVRAGCFCTDGPANSSSHPPDSRFSDGGPERTSAPRHYPLRPHAPLPTRRKSLRPRVDINSRHLDGRRPMGSVDLPSECGTRTRRRVAALISGLTMGRILVILTGTFLLCVGPTHGRVLGGQKVIRSFNVEEVAILAEMNAIIQRHLSSRRQSERKQPWGYGLDSSRLSGSLQSVCTGYLRRLA
jgi:hypothetical protein